MSNGLEQFMRNNRDEFDTDEPSERIWKNLEQELTAGNHTEPKQTTKASVSKQCMKLLRWSAAAAILILAGIGIYSLLNNRLRKWSCSS